ncbi:alpha-L-rhamnosidase [Nocardioides sp. CER19]|uniref:alpha-L-rhamnosidase n=1 Tax=Nocardioides sp. CER19 TaxID=3038538 RepID=UPI00244B71B4|nr:alpha-L-rhamnosidase [Nocardioides sp. CER19]MDH2416221.1 family 78 glycoside hydrolase catalytic domain [Nocardioides sp. CER19]
MADSVGDLRRGRIEGTTGRVVSGEHDNIAFTGLDLESRQTVAWQVRIWDDQGRISAWSRPATWEMGLIGNDAWTARWIENPHYDYTQPDGTETPLPVFGTSFHVDKPVARARLYITGLGMYAATVNGKPAGEAVLEPGQTTYADEVGYRTYDVTSSLERGANVVGVETGSGTYQRVKTPGHYFFGGGLEKYTVYGEPKVIAQLEITYADGRRQVVASDGSWKTALGPTTYSSWWSGEEYDARRAATDPSSAARLAGHDWTNAAPAPLSGTTTPRTDTPLVANPRPPVTVAERVRPKAISKVGDSWVLDFGANRSGWPDVSLEVPAGTTVTMTPAEQLNPDGTINTASTGASATKGAIAYKYTAAGHRRETWHPQFTYSGFRYLRVDGLAQRPSRDTVTMLVVHAANPRASSFSSSSHVLNDIHAMTVRSTESNMMSVLTDCPDREKGPYTGDNLHNIDALLTQFDMSAYEPQLVRNMATAQRKAGDESPGLIANIAPEFHRVAPVKLNYPQGVIEFLDEVNWGGAIIRIPWKLYTTYGDTRTMSRYYDNMVKWLDYEAANRAENNGDIPGLGDWSASDNTTPMQLAIYAGYYTAADEMSKIAGVLGKQADQAKYRALADELAQTFNARFRHTDVTGVYYGSDSEASNAMALDAGLVADADREAVTARLVAAVRRSGNHITTGSVALGPLFRALQTAGRDDVVYDMVTNKTAPGYGYLVATGHTTLSEDFSGGGSQNHHFLGQVDSWFVSGLAGIQQAAGSIGYRKLVIKPAFVGDLTDARGTYETPQGRVASSWHKSRSGHITLRVDVPSGTTASVELPRAAVTHVTGDAQRAGTAYTVGAGSHVFDVLLR